MLLRSQAKLKNVKSLTFFRGKRRKKSRNLLKYVLKKKTFESMDIKPHRRKNKKKKINKLPKQGLLSELQSLKGKFCTTFLIISQFSILFKYPT